MKIAKISLLVNIFLIPVFLTAQESIILIDSVLTGDTYEKVARNAIFLKPGFNYNAVNSHTFWAHIDETLPQQEITPVECAQSSSFPVDIDPSLPVGAIPGQAGVSPSGAATYTVPIEVPPAAQGMQPNLSVVYNSQAGNGIMGMGWNLAGLSAITRVPKNIYNDGVVEEIKLDYTDNFAFDGQRLILTNGELGKENSEYHTEVESFVQVTAKGTSGNGPQWFEVKTKDGLTMQFGNTNDSRIAGANNNVIAWKINRIEDQFSNYMVFEYMTDDDEQPISTIKYGGNTQADKDPYNFVNFNYVTRNDVNTTWPAGKEITTNLLLRSIEIISEEAFVKKYEFEYKCGYSSLLSIIKLTGSDGEKLNVTKIEWDNGNLYNDAFFNTPNQLNNLGIGWANTTYFPGDFDGNGISELFQVTYGIENEVVTYNSWKLFFKNEGSSTYTLGSQGTFEGNNVHKIFVIDSDNDGKDEIFYTHKWHHVDENGTGFDYTDLRKRNVIEKVWHPLSDFSVYSWFTDYNIKVGDFDGDGESDFLGSDLVLKNYAVRGIQSNSNDEMQLLDFNGNGKTDIMLIDETGTLGCRIYEYREVSNTYELIYLNSFPSVDNNVFLGEFNGDGKTDLLYYDNRWKIKFSNGSEFVDLGNLSGLWGDENILHYVIDFNNDGISDIIEIRFEVLWTEFDQYGQGWPVWSTTCRIGYGTGNGNFIFKSMVYPGRVFLNNENYFADFNGDGMIDILYDYFWKYYNGYVWRTYDDYPLIFYTNKNNLTQLATTITNGLDQQSNFSYKKHKLKNFNASDAFYKFIEQPVFLAAGFTTEDNGIPVNQELTFTNPYIHKQGKGFLGFSDVEIKDNISGFTQKSTYRMESSKFNVCFMPMQASSDPPSPALFSTLYQPILEETSIMKTNDEILSKITYNFDVDITDPCLHLNYELFYVSLKTKTTENYLQNLTTTTNYSYDNYGNPLTVTTDYNGDAGVHVSNTYTGFGDWWCPKSRLQQSTVTKTRPGESNFPATTRFEYNTEGALTNKFSFNNQPKQVTENYDDFDSFGNPRKITVSAAGLETRQTTLEYNDGFGRFITKKTNALGHSEEFTYDGKTGNLLTYTDVNDLFTRNKYDGFGRLETTIHPNGNTTQITRKFEIDGDQLYSVREVTGGQPEQKTWYDHLGRKIKTGTKGFDGMVYSDIQYTPKGEVYKVSEPYTGSPSQYTEYEYLGDGRVDEITYPTGVTNTYAYTPGSTEVTVSSSNETWKTTKTDGTGTLIMAKDAGGQIDYTYFAHGGVKNITYGDVETNMTYDIYGRQETLADPDAGTITYDYNAFGELASQTDSRGNTYNMTYDLLGRLKEKKLLTSPVATYIYDTAPGKGIGKLASISGNNNISYVYSYDEFGRLFKKTENIQGRSFTTETNYNEYSQVNQIKYPGSTLCTVENQYQNGYLRNVNTATGDIFTATGYNLRDQITGYDLGNGLSTTRGYDDYGFLTSIQTPGIQDLEYNFNVQTGNLNYRKDVPRDLKESFTYDNLMKNRLETWQLNSGEKGTIIYYANGNIDSKTLLGSYHYESASPHAVTSVDNTDNWIETQEQTISYTPFNRVETIREGDYKLQIIYGPDNERKKTILYRNANSPVPLKSTEETINWVPYKTKYFVDGIYEEEIIDALVDNHRELNYIFGGDGLSAIFVKDNGGENLYYIHKDHLGSYQSITNASGALVEEMNFDPWGNRRNPADWTFPAAEEYHLFDRGFTGHEHLDQFNLINMNGRVYDPVLGRFLSPDNYVQAPDYTQSLNRYSYTLNNPLKYTDPSGESWKSFWKGVGNVFNNFGDWMTRNNITFQVGYNSTYGPGFSFGDNPMYYPGYEQKIVEGQQNIANYLTGFSGWNDDAPLFPELKMPTMEGGVEFVPSGQGDGVGQPGTWEGLIPIWGSGRAAVDHFQNGNYWRGVGYSALAISDVFLVKSIATAVGRGAWKVGAHSWSATRQWLGKTGYAEAGQPVHHWAISQATAKQYGIEAFTNQPWNLMTFSNQSLHMRAGHGLNYLGQPGYGVMGQLWFGTPIWPKAVVGSYGGRLIGE